MSTKFYVYELWNPIKNEIFYVGKSHYQNNRSRLDDHLKEAQQVINLKRKSNHKINTIIKILREGYDIDFRIVYETNSEPDAFNKEMELINHYGRRDLKTGPLTNLTAGGEGVRNYVRPNWLKKLYSIKFSGKGNPMYGKHHSEKSRLQMSKTWKSRIKSGEIVPNKHSDEWKQHLRENNAGGKATQKAVYQIDKHGTIVKKFESLSEASDQFCESSYSIISGIASRNPNGRHVTYKGYFWRYVNDYDPNEDFKKIYDSLAKKSKIVYQYDINMNLVKTYKSLSELHRVKTKSLSFLHKVVTNNILFENHYWSYNPPIT